MDLVFMVVLGFLAALVAQVMTPGLKPFGPLATAVLGVLGAFGATIIGRGFGLYAADQTAGFLGALIGALVLVTAYRLLLRDRSPGRQRPRFEPIGRESTEP